MQHASDMSPGPVSGQLLGMSREGEPILEVTDMFPFAPALTDESEQDDYILEMLRCLRDVNVDHTAVGWYQSVSLDAFLQPSFIESQASYQAELPNSCVLVYDHMRSAQGVPSVRAFRLQDGFMRAWREAQKSGGRVSHGLIADLVKGGIVVELDVQIAVSAMDKLLISTLVEDKSLPEANVIGSDDSIRLTLVRLAQNILLSLDDSIAESSRGQHYIRSVGKQQQALQSQIQKRRSENAQRVQNGEAAIPEDDLQLNLKGISEPPRLGLIVSSSQLESLMKVCEEVFASLQAKEAL